MTLIVLSVAVLLHVQVMRFRFERPTQWLHSEATVHQAFLLLPKQQMWNADQKKKQLFANYAFPLYGLTWSMEHQSGTHAHFKKELESTQKFACKVITRNWDKGYEELLDTTNLQIESCTSNCAPYTKLCTISLIFLVYLKSLRVAEIWNMCS